MSAVVDGIAAVVPAAMSAMCISLAAGQAEDSKYGQNQCNALHDTNPFNLGEVVLSDILLYARDVPMAMDLCASDFVTWGCGVSSFRQSPATPLHRVVRTILGGVIVTT
jgi:hypothetical protein